MNHDQGMVFNIQRYSIHDGPGIRTTVFLKGCPLRCFWCQNPESQSGKPEILLDSRKCTLCGLCYHACQHDAIRLDEDRPVFLRGACRGCGQCVAVCPNEVRRVSGRSMTVAEVMREVVKDLKFYENSGGGVTLSGGEPLAQPDFARQFLKECKQSDLHTTLDTCGYAPWSEIEKLLDYVDLVYFDIKHLNAAKHDEATGQDNRLILENARKIAKRKPMRIRIPLIPGFNDSVEVVGEIAAFVRNELNGLDIDLLPYNRMGEVKYDFLDKKTISPLPTQADDHLRTLESLIVGQTPASP